MTLTLEIPDELAARMENIPADQRNNYAIAALFYGLDYLLEQGKPDPETIEALRQAFPIGRSDNITVFLED